MGWRKPVAFRRNSLFGARDSSLLRVKKEREREKKEKEREKRKPDRMKLECPLSGYRREKEKGGVNRGNKRGKSES